MHIDLDIFLKKGKENISINEILDKIRSLSNDIFDFWQGPREWAPYPSVDLLEAAKLDWLRSLTDCLEIWTSPNRKGLTEGEILLARVNLGALVEGWLKLFYCVYYEDYKKDTDAYKDRKGKLIKPNNLRFEDLKNFSEGRLWKQGELWFDWVDDIQYKRNAIHAFNKREIGNETELIADIKMFYKFIILINGRLPYP